jgi:hypothetical protein
MLPYSGRLKLMYGKLQRAAYCKGRLQLNSVPGSGSLQPGCARASLAKCLTQAEDGCVVCLFPPQEPVS